MAEEPSLESRLVDVAKDETAFSHPMGRRAFLKCCAVAGVSLAGISGVGAILAGCGGETTTTTAGGATTTAGASSTTLPAVKTGLIGLSVIQLADTTFVLQREVAQACAKALNCDFTIMEHQWNANLSVAYPGQLAAMNSNAMMLGMPAADAPMPGVAAECDAKKVWLANDWFTPAWYTPDRHPYWVHMIRPAAFAGGYFVAKDFFERMGGEGTFIWVTGNKTGNSAETDRRGGVEKAVSEYPGIKMYMTADSNWNIDGGKKALQDALPAVGDFKAVICCNDAAALGAIATLEANNIKDKLVAGFDGGDLNMKYIQEGKQTLSAGSFETLMIAHDAVDAFDAMNGYEWKLVERLLFSETVIITPDNVDELYKTFYTDIANVLDYPRMSRVLHPDDWDPQSGYVPANPYAMWSGRYPQDTVKLTAPWEDALTKDFTAARQACLDHWKTGPTIKYKGTPDLILEEPNNTAEYRG